MKFVKGISLFFLFPLTMLVIGFYAGVKTTKFYYSIPDTQWGLQDGAGPDLMPDQEGLAYQDKDASVGKDGASYESLPSDATHVSDAVPVSENSETLYVGTKYVLEETDVLRHTSVETVWDLPDKYVGMNREQFLAAMDTYASSPPLTELQRGFVGLEVLSFSRERVVVRMDYRYVLPTSSFYLAVYDNCVRVYLDDRKTVYIDTEISLDTLPYELQQEIIRVKWIEDEESLYSFLETYSS